MGRTVTTFTDIITLFPDCFFVHFVFCFRRSFLLLTSFTVLSFCNESQFVFFVLQPCNKTSRLPFPNNLRQAAHLSFITFGSMSRHLESTFLTIFRNEITTILTPSTSEGGEWGRWR